MVKNSHNNKVNNYINIVNDLKGLGLLRRKRRASSSASGTMQSKQQTKPQISGIEKTIIDNSPQLRRDVEQLANERSLLADRVMENENRFNFLHQQINENPGRFFERGPQRDLSNVDSNSLRLPTMNQLYDDDLELRNDGVNVPIVDASNNFKPRMNYMPDDETTEALASMASSNNNNDVSVQKPKQLNFYSNTQEEGDELIKRIERLRALGKPKEIPVRNTSPKPTPRKETSLALLASPNTMKKREAYLAKATPEDLEIVKKHWGENLDLKPPAQRYMIEKAQSSEKEKTESKAKGEEEKEPELKQITSAQRKAILAKERKQQELEIAELKANENPSLAELSKERLLADAKTDNLIQAHFKNFGGKEYVLENVKKDLDKIEKLATDDSSFVLNKTNQELMEKYYGYLKLSGSIQKFAGRGYGSTTLLFNIPGIKKNLSKRLHMPNLWQARMPSIENRSSSVPIQRSTGIHTLNDIASAGSGNIKA